MSAERCCYLTPSVWILVRPPNLHCRFAPTKVADSPIPPPATASSPLTSPTTISPTKSANFTFVNQADDLTALTHRKISNTEQRHAIRSHVMQRVRKEELAQGKKRPTGRDLPRRSSNQTPRSASGDSESPVKREPTSISPAIVKEEPNDTALKAPRARGRSKSALIAKGHVKYVSLQKSPAVHEFDPFQTLPSGELSHKSLESLLSHCFDTLIPMTFTVEVKSTSERLARQGMVLQTKISSPPVFFGFMATVAAHRSICHGAHKDLAPSSINHDDLIDDLDYKRAKQEAIVAVRKAVESRSEPDEYLVDACFGLVSTATIVGNLEEAKIHLNGIASMMSSHSNLQGSQDWVPIANVKISTALLCRPSLPIGWPREPIPTTVLSRITPNPGSEQSRLTSGFMSMEQLSDELKALLWAHKDICNLYEYVAANPRQLTSLENGIFNKKSIELEYDYVVYAFESSCPSSNYSSADGHRENDEPVLPALEAMIRLAGLGLCSEIPHFILPAFGSGRALTLHQKQATERWLQERGVPNVHDLWAVIWALFIFAQRSLHQPEQAFFANLLRQLTQEVWLHSWEDVEATMYGFLYMPRLHSKIWKQIWEGSI